jgi:hypothetical protein
MSLMLSPSVVSSWPESDLALSEHAWKLKERVDRRVGCRDQVDRRRGDKRLRTPRLGHTAGH